MPAFLCLRELATFEQGMVEAAAPPILLVERALQRTREMVADFLTKSMHRIHPSLLAQVGEPPMAGSDMLGWTWLGRPTAVHLEPSISP